MTTVGTRKAYTGPGMQEVSFSVERRGIAERHRDLLLSAVAQLQLTQGAAAPAGA